MPLSALFTLGLTIWCATVPYLLYFTEREAGGNGSLRKTAVTGLFIFFFLGLLYVCIGFYQMFFIELRKKFLARKVEYRDGEFALRGWYFKKDGFQETDVILVEPYSINPHWFSKNIMSMFTRTRCNYKVMLKDGRVIYLPGQMDRVDELKVLLEKCALANVASVA